MEVGLVLLDVSQRLERIEAGISSSGARSRSTRRGCSLPVTACGPEQSYGAEIGALAKKELYTGDTADFLRSQSC